MKGTPLSQNPKRRKTGSLDGLPSLESTEDLEISERALLEHAEAYERDAGLRYDERYDTDLYYDTHAQGSQDAYASLASGQATGSLPVDTTHRTPTARRSSSRRSSSSRKDAASERRSSSRRCVHEEDIPSASYESLSDAQSTSAFQTIKNLLTRQSVQGDVPHEEREHQRKRRGNAPESGRAHGPAKQPLFAQAQKTLPLAIFFLELVFKGGTTGGFFPSVIFIALFSIVVGQLLFLLTSLAKEPKVNHIVRVALLALLAVAFGVEYFVYRQFKVYYDLITITGGAGHAGGQFGDHIAALIFNPVGILMVVLFLAPALVAAVLFTHRVDSKRMNVKQGISAIVTALAAHLLALLLVFASGAYGLTYNERYNFQTSVENFGLLVSLRKEVSKNLFGSKQSYSFDTDATLEHAAQTTNTSKTSINYGKNKLDIDFAALAETTDGTWASLDQYVASQTASSKNEMTGRFKGYNLIFISAEAFSAEAIRPDVTPTLYRMANKGIQFLDYYQPASAGTTGGEYQNLFGMLPSDGGASFQDTATHNNEMTMGWALNALGYNGWAFHNNDYTYYERHITHNSIGYNNGFMGYGNGMEEYVEWQWPESDLEMIKGTFDNIYGDSSPFNVYYMSVSGHSLYSYDNNDMSIKWKDTVEAFDLPYSETVRAYLACNVDLDRAMEYLIGQLEEKGIADRTAIVIAADHFPYGLDGDASLGYLPYLSELYGYSVQTSFQRDHNRLIIWSGSLEDEDPIVVDEPTSSLDILPTLMNLFGIEFDSRLLPGRDVFSDRSPLVFDLIYDWKTDLGTYTADSDSFEPVEGATIPDGYVDTINAVVANKINYCSAVLETDYMSHVFGAPKDVNEVNALGKQNTDYVELTGDPILDAVHNAESEIENRLGLISD